MKRIFWGILLAFLDINLDLPGGARVGLLPDFIGYYLIYRGLCQIAFESEQLAKAKPFAKTAIAVSAVFYVLDILLTPGWGAGALGIAAGLAFSVLYLYVLYLLVLGIQDIETSYGCKIGGGKLRVCLNVLAVCTIAAYPLALLSALLAAYAAVGAFAALVIFALLFFSTASAYDALPHEPSA